MVIVTRVEKHNIKKNHKLWKYCDEYCLKQKNLYNYANYIVRQEFINNGKWIQYNELYKLVKEHETYKATTARTAQQTLKLLDRNWKSFFKAIKEYKINSDKFLGKPKLPKYADKNGRKISIFTNQCCKIKGNKLIFPKSFDKFELTTKTSNLQQVRIIPNGSCYTVEIVYKTEIFNCLLNKDNFISIDLGLNNFAAIVNNIGLKPIIINGKIIKANNQYYNKQLASIKSQLKKNNKSDWSNKLERLTTKRNNKINDFVHKISRYVIDYCYRNNIGKIIIGYNKEWKQNINLRKATNQNFVNIPYYKFLQMINYKAVNLGIEVIETEESYTSGTSSLDNELPVKENYNKKRRVKRGLFKSNDGKFINSDVNGAYQISKKVIPNAYADGIEALGLVPVKANIA